MSLLKRKEAPSVSVMTRLNKRSAVFATVEVFFFFVVLTSLYVMAGPLAYGTVAKLSGYLEEDWAQLSIGKCFELTPIWCYVVQGVLYLPLVAFYWAPSDNKANEAELTGLGVFALLLPVALYVWIHWCGSWLPGNPRIEWEQAPHLLAGINLAAFAVVALIVGAVAFTAAARYLLGLSDKPSGRCLGTWAASCVLGVSAGSLVGIIAAWAMMSALGPEAGITTGLIVGIVVCVLNQWAAIRELMGITYGQAILAWLVPFAVTAIGVLAFGAAKMVIEIIG